MPPVLANAPEFGRPERAFRGALDIDRQLGTRCDVCRPPPPTRIRDATPDPRPRSRPHPGCLATDRGSARRSRANKGMSASSSRDDDGKPGRSTMVGAFRNLLPAEDPDTVELHAMEGRGGVGREERCGVCRSDQSVAAGTYPDRRFTGVSFPQRHGAARPKRSVDPVPCRSKPGTGSALCRRIA